MKITNIEITKSKATLSFDNHPDVVLPIDIYYENYLAVDDEISGEKIKQIIKISQRASFQRYAFNLFSRKAYTEAQITEKLKNKGATNTDIEIIIDRLKKAYLLNDRNFINDFLQLAKERGYGKHKILQKLTQAGIPKYLLQQLQFNEAEEMEKAQFLFPKLLNKYRNYNAHQQQEKVYRAFMEAGYEREVVIQVLANYDFVDVARDYTLLQRDLAKAIRLYKKISDNYEKKAKITRYLLQRRYNYNDILKVVEANNDND